jgi:hypothetical protein
MGAPSWEDIVHAWSPKCPDCGQPLEYEEELECVNQECPNSPYYPLGKKAARDKLRN